MSENLIDTILEERASRYGSFKQVATVSQDIKAVIFHYSKHRGLAADQLEALDMIASKIARIVNGDPHYIDSWDDIAGYAKLVSDRLRQVGAV